MAKSTDLSKSWIGGGSRGTTTFNAPGSTTIAYGRYKGTVSGRGGSGNAPTALTYSITYSTAYPYVSTNPTTYNTVYAPTGSNYSTAYPYVSTNPTTYNTVYAPTGSNYSTAYPYVSTNPTTYNTIYPYVSTNPTTYNTIYPYVSTNPTTYNTVYPYVSTNPTTYNTVYSVVNQPVAGNNPPTSFNWYEYTEATMFFEYGNSSYTDYNSGSNPTCPAGYYVLDQFTELYVNYSCTGSGSTSNYNTNYSTNYPATPGNANYSTNYPATPGNANYSTNYPATPGNANYSTNYPATPGNANYSTVYPFVSTNYSTNYPATPGNANYSTVYPFVSTNYSTNYPATPGNANYSTVYTETARPINVYNVATGGTPTTVLGVYFPGGSANTVAPYISETVTDYWNYPDSANYPVAVPSGGQIIVKIE